MIFAATDAGEKGLYGAKAFVTNPPVPLAAIAVNLNWICWPRAVDVTDCMSRPPKPYRNWLSLLIVQSIVPDYT
jgi:hypothetical protein